MSLKGRFYLDKEKDIVVDFKAAGTLMNYVLSTPNHHSGNLIRNLARLCQLPLSRDDNGLFIIEGVIPCYIDASNRMMFIFRLGNTKVANIYPDGTVEMKASIPSISKTLMSQTKNYRLGIEKTIIKTYILAENKFRTDLHTHMNANLSPDILIALGIYHQIRYPLYYIKKLGLHLSADQEKEMQKRRAHTEEMIDVSDLFGKYRERKLDDNTFINLADLLLNNPADTDYNVSHIRTSLAILKDGQAVFTNLEKVYLYRYVFTKGIPSEDKILINDISAINDQDIADTYKQIQKDHQKEPYKNNTVFEDKLLWIARSYARQGVEYVEISDTTLGKKQEAFRMLESVHRIMPPIRKETGVMIRFLAAFRRIPLTLVKANIEAADYLNNNLATLKVIAQDPYVAGCDFVGEEINSILDLRKAIKEVVRIAAGEESFVVRIHAGENDSLKDNVANSIRIVKESLAPGQKMPQVRIGHGLYTANLTSRQGQELINSIRDNNVILEFQMTSNVRLNNLNSLASHPIRRYLAHDLKCVQGSDGPALYGTCSIDEQLSLEKLLDLTGSDMRKMKKVEDEVLAFSYKGFEDKSKRLQANLKGRKLYDYYCQLLDDEKENYDISLLPEGKVYATDAFKERIKEIPDDKIPVIIAGGSFNTENRVTRTSHGNMVMIDKLLERLDPADVCFVVGHKMEGYERYLAHNNEKGFEIYAVMPSLVNRKERKKILQEKVYVRISPEIVGMGIYKSFNYEIFERRESVLILLDGNAAALNLLQEARNGKAKSHIFVNETCQLLKRKAASLQGYVTVFNKDDDIVAKICDIIEDTKSGL